MTEQVEETFFNEVLNILLSTSKSRSRIDDTDSNLHESLFYVPKEEKEFKDVMELVKNESEDLTFYKRNSYIKLKSDNLRGMLVHVIKTPTASEIQWPKDLHKFPTFKDKAVKNKKEMGLPDNVEVFNRDQMWKVKGKDSYMTIFHITVKESKNFNLLKNEEIKKIDKKGKPLFRLGLEGKNLSVVEKITQGKNAYNDTRRVKYKNNHKQCLGYLGFTTLNKFNVISFGNKIKVLDTPTLLLPFNSIKDTMLKINERVKVFGKDIQDDFYYHCYYAVRELLGIVKFQADLEGLTFTESIEKAWSYLLNLDSLPKKKLTEKTINKTIETEYAMDSKKYYSDNDKLIVIATSFAKYFSDDWNQKIKLKEIKIKKNKENQKKLEQDRLRDRDENISEIVKVVNKIFEVAYDNLEKRNKINASKYEISYWADYDDAKLKKDGTSMTLKEENIQNFNFYNEYQRNLGVIFKRFI